SLHRQRDPLVRKRNLDRVLVLRHHLRPPLAASVPSVGIAVATMSAVEPYSLVCSYCQAPLNPAGWGRSARLVKDQEEVFCCLGCRMAAAIVQEKGEAGAARGLLTRLGLSIFFTMNVMAFTMALWTTDVYDASDPSNRLLPALQGLFRYVVL